HGPNRTSFAPRMRAPATTRPARFISAIPISRASRCSRRRRRRKPWREGMTTMDAAAAPDLRTRLAADPGAILEAVSKESNVSLRQVVEALPGTMRRFAPGDCFIEAMGEIATWGDVTLVIHSDDGVMEFTGLIPA